MRSNQFQASRPSITFLTSHIVVNFFYIKSSCTKCIRTIYFSNNCYLIFIVDHVIKVTVI